MQCERVEGIPVGVEAPLARLVEFPEGTEASLAWGFPAGAPAAPAPAAALALATAAAAAAASPLG